VGIVLSHILGYYCCILVGLWNSRCHCGYLMLFLMFSFQTFLATMVANIRELIVWSRHLALFNNVYEFSMIIVPSIIVAPRYFSGEVNPMLVS
jgi:hypothetical protein